LSVAERVGFDTPNPPKRLKPAPILALRPTDRPRGLNCGKVLQFWQAIAHVRRAETPPLPHNGSVNKPQRTPKKRTQLEATFTSFVRSFGGEVVEDLLPAKAGSVAKNADYLLFDRSVVAELKCLQKNYLNAVEVEVKMKRLIAAWRKDGSLRDEHFVNGLVSTENLPERCQREAVGIFAQPLKKAAKKAHEQIRSTKELFSLPHAKGLLIVANDGNFSLPPDMAVKILRDLFSDSFPEIHSFIYFSPGMEVVVRGIDEAKRFWVDGAARDSLDQVPPELLVDLRSAWVKFIDCTEIVVKSDLIGGVGFAAVDERKSR
jgi:hypothetical protein